MWCRMHHAVDAATMSRQLFLAAVFLLGVGGAGSGAMAQGSLSVGVQPGVQPASVQPAGAHPESARSGGDADKGEQLYARCVACHSLTVDRTGPRHCGLLGRRAGAVPGFAYSEAMRQSGIVWTTVTLDRFLANPLKAMPGTAMGYAGISDPKERADLVAFLARASSSASCAS